MQAKQDAREEKLRYKERQENMHLLMGTMASFAAAMSGKPVDIPVPMVTAAPSKPDNDSNDLSSICTSVASFDSSSSNDSKKATTIRRRRCP
jgi:hypothetical protein